MWILGYFLGLFLLSSFWYFFLKIFYNSEKKFFYKIEFFILSFLAWIILIPFFLFLAWWIWIQLSFLNIFLITIFLNIFLIWINFFLKTKISFEKFNFIKEIKNLNIFYKFLILFWTIWIFWKLFLGGLSILNVPTYQDDTFWNWNYRWQIFFEREDLVLNKEDDNFLWAWYRQYPMTISLSKTYLAKFYWDWDKWMVNLISFLFYISSLLFLFFVLFRETRDLKWWFLWLFILSSIPLYHIHWTNPYFDLMQWLYLFIPTYLLFKYLENSEENKNLFYLSIVFIWFLGLTKNEWLSMYFPIMVISLIWIVFIKKFFLWDNLKLNKSDLIKSFLVFLMPIVFLIFKNIYDLWFWNWNNKISEYPIEYSAQAMNAVKFAIFSEWNFNLLWFFILFLILFFLINNFKKIKEKIWIFILILFFIWFLFVDIWLLVFVKSLHKEAISQIWVNRILIHISLLWVFISMILSFNFLNKKWT